jgi:hypothetical protein
MQVGVKFVFYGFDQQSVFDFVFFNTIMYDYFKPLFQIFLPMFIILCVNYSSGVSLCIR